MRWVLNLGLAAVSSLSLLAGGVRAQSPGYYNRLSGHSRTTTVAPGATPDQGRPDPFTPYGSRPRGDSGVGPYRRTSSEPPPRPEPRAVTVERSHNYFPTMRVGQGPNRNYIPPHRLCVPGRRPFLYNR